MQFSAPHMLFSYWMASSQFQLQTKHPPQMNTDLDNTNDERIPGAIIHDYKKCDKINFCSYIWQINHLHE
jgi:hypothetical protein